MSRRDRSQLNQFFVEDSKPVTVQEVDEAFFGEIAAIDSLRQTAEPIDIFSIYSMPSQPRRTIPTVVRIHWNGQPDSIAEMFNIWLNAVVQERFAARKSVLSESERHEASQFKLHAYLEEDEDHTDREHSPGPIETSFLQVISLAASIRRDNLTNPITVARSGTNYILETGERRWLAYHLLFAYFDGISSELDERERWKRIPANIVDDASLWRMANENNVRENLNAIGKARQFALLMMDLYTRQGHRFLFYSDIVQKEQSDRAFYAQVANGNEYPMPRGRSEMLLNAMGFKSKSQLREHRALLELPDEVWQIADDLNWAYGKIRNLMRKAQSLQELIYLAQKEAERDGLSVGIPTLSHTAKIPQLPETPSTLPDKGEHTRGKTLLSPEKRSYLKWLMSIRSGVGQADAATRKLVLDKIASTRQWLDDMEKLVND